MPNFILEFLLKIKKFSIKDLGIKKKFLMLVISFFVFMIILLLAFRVSFNLVKSVQAFIQGEGLWSKNQMLSVYYLDRYLYTNKEKDYQKFVKYYNVITADRIFLTEIQKKRKDFNNTLAHQNYLLAGNNPENYYLAPLLMRYFKNLGIVKEAFSHWKKGDAKAQDIYNLGKKIHKEIQNNQFTTMDREEYGRKIEKLNSEIIENAGAFSEKLSDLTVFLDDTLFVVVFLFSLFLVILWLIIYKKTSSNIINEINAVNLGAARLAFGDLESKIIIDSKDELADLAQSINLMAEKLNEAQINLKKKNQDLEKTKKNLEEKLNQLKTIKKNIMSAEGRY